MQNITCSQTTEFLKGEHTPWRLQDSVLKVYFKLREGMAKEVYRELFFFLKESSLWCYLTTKDKLLNFKTPYLIEGFNCETEYPVASPILT